MSEDNDKDITEEVREAMEEEQDGSEGSSDSDSEPIATLDCEGQDSREVGYRSRSTAVEQGQEEVGAPHVEGSDSQSESSTPEQGSAVEGEDDLPHVQTVTLNVQVPAPGATEEQMEMYEQFARLFEERFETFVSKNIDYGSSFLTAGQVDAALSGEHDGPFDTSQEANLYKLFTRIQDKDQRFYQQTFCGGQDLVGEDIGETAGDAGVYWFMIEWLVRNRLDE